MSVQGALCPPHHKLLCEHREDYPACLQCEINVLSGRLLDIADIITTVNERIATSLTGTDTLIEMTGDEIREIERLAKEARMANCVCGGKEEHHCHSEGGSKQ